MALADQIMEDLKAAMKARDTAKLSALRMLRSEIRNREIELGESLGDEEIENVIRRMLKKRRESIEAYADAGRDELRAQEEAEAEALETYLPAELGDDELGALVDATIAETGVTDPKEFGRVMGPVMKKVAGRADGNRVRAMVQQRLEQSGS